MKLSEIIRKYRADHDMSQREFAKRCNLSNSYISFIENECNPKTGRPMTPTIEQYKKIADGMSITVQELFESLDVDSPVKLNIHSSNDFNFQRFAGEPSNKLAPQTPEARAVSFGMDQLSQEQREMILNMVRAMFPNNKFSEGDDK